MSVHGILYIYTCKFASKKMWLHLYPYIYTHEQEIKQEGDNIGCTANG